MPAPSSSAGKLLCLGRNYAAHAREMGADPDQPPLVFLKPASAIVQPPELIELPDWSSEVHHEVELVVEIGRRARNIQAHQARSHIAGYRVGIDLTARDVQRAAKEQGHPWSIAKGFDGAAPLGPLITPANLAGDIDDCRIALWVDDELRQDGRTSSMIWGIDQTLAFLSTRFTLDPGDLVFLGTPAGVGPIGPGQELRALIDALGELRIRIAA